MHGQPHIRFTDDVYPVTLLRKRISAACIAEWDAVWFHGPLRVCVSEKGAKSTFADAKIVSAVGVEWDSFGLCCKCSISTCGFHKRGRFS